MQARARVRLNGARGAGLIVGGLYCLIRGVAYLPLGDVPSELPGGLKILTTSLPIWVWAIVWIVAAGTCMVCAFRKDDYLGWGALVALPLIWGLAYLSGWILSFFDPGGPSREFLNASSYGLLPLVIILLLRSQRAHVRPGREATHGERR